MPTNNMMDFMKFVKNGNPQEIVMNMLQQDMKRGKSYSWHFNSND